MWFAWELIWRKNSDFFLGGGGGMVGLAYSLPKDKIYAIWGYPKVSFMEIKSNILFLTATYWHHLSDNQVKAPTLQDFKQLITTAIWITI